MTREQEVLLGLVSEELLGKSVLQDEALASLSVEALLTEARSQAVELMAAEKTLLNAYRKADAETQKAALNLLKGEKQEDILSGLLSMLGNFGK